MPPDIPIDTCGPETLGHLHLNHLPWSEQFSPFTPAGTGLHAPAAGRLLLLKVLSAPKHFPSPPAWRCQPDIDSYPVHLINTVLLLPGCVGGYRKGKKQKNKSIYIFPPPEKFLTVGQDSEYNEAVSIIAHL